MTTHATAITLPDGIDFADIKLTRKPTGAISFDWRPIEAICAANSLDIAIFRDQDEDNVAGLIAAWYHAHLAAGGARDSTADDLIAEVMAEDKAGSPTYTPGRA